MLLQFRIVNYNLNPTTGIGGIVRRPDQTWILYAKVPFKSGFWGRVPERGGFLAPEDEVSLLPPDKQDAVRKIYRAGIIPDLASVVESPLRPGDYHPRIWRGQFDPSKPSDDFAPDPAATYGATFIQSVTSAVSLFDGLLGVFRVIEPDSTNYSSFGHRLRELLILACTEVEANLRSIYVPNFSPTNPDVRTTTREYVQLREPLALNQWTVALREYPNLPSLTPFETWSDERPTQSIPWYDAYNSVKHDRERHFPRATLAHLMDAMAALHVVLAAQWGPAIFSFLNHNYPSPFRITKAPTWPSGAFYLPPLTDEGDVRQWTPIPLATSLVIER